MRSIEFEYGIKRSFDEPFESVAGKIRSALKAEGFGVITEIDLKEKFKEKLNEDFVDYLILGACNPAFAYEAVRSDMDIGLLLPCNVVLYSEDGKTVATVVDAGKMLSLTGNGKMEAMAAEVNERLRRALDSIPVGKDAQPR